MKNKVFEISLARRMIYTPIQLMISFIVYTAVLSVSFSVGSLISPEHGNKIGLVIGAIFFAIYGFRFLLDVLLRKVILTKNSVIFDYYLLPDKVFYLKESISRCVRLSSLMFFNFETVGGKTILGRASYFYSGFLLGGKDFEESFAFEANAREKNFYFSSPLVQYTEITEKLELIEKRKRNGTFRIF